jgi:hypothetical protein
MTFLGNSFDVSWQLLSCSILTADGSFKILKLQEIEVTLSCATGQGGQRSGQLTENPLLRKTCPQP